MRDPDSDFELCEQPLCERLAVVHLKGKVWLFVVQHPLFEILDAAYSGFVQDFLASGSDALDFGERSMQEQFFVACSGSIMRSTTPSRCRKYAAKQMLVDVPQRVGLQLHLTQFGQRVLKLDFWC